MRRLFPWCSLLALALAVPAGARTSVNVSIGVGNAPPPPVVVWHSEPRLAVMPSAGVWYYDGPSDYDYFRCGSYFYIYNGGYWYRSPYYRGPFVVIREEYVPRVFYGLHDRGYHWRHGWKTAPPGQVRKMERRERDRDRDHDRGHGHGHGYDGD